MTIPKANTNNKEVDANVEVIDNTDNHDAPVQTENNGPVIINEAADTTMKEGDDTQNADEINEHYQASPSRREVPNVITYVDKTPNAGDGSFDYQLDGEDTDKLKALGLDDANDNNDGANQFQPAPKKRDKTIEINADADYLSGLLPNRDELNKEFNAKMKELYGCTIEDVKQEYLQDAKDIGNTIYVELQKANSTNREEAIEILKVAIGLIKATKKDEVTGAIVLTDEHFALITRSTELAQKAEGCTCYVRISGGLLLILAGVALMAAAVAAVVLTGGFSTPISIPGLEIGKDFIIAGLVALTAAVAAIGYFSTSFGSTCMTSGVQHGVSAALAKFSALFAPIKAAQPKTEVTKAQDNPSQGLTIKIEAPVGNTIKVEDEAPPSPLKLTV